MSGIRKHRKRRVKTALPAGPLSPHSMESTLLDLHKHLEEMEFESEDELNAYLASLAGKRPEEIFASRPRSKAERAQDLAYQAMDAESPVEMMGLATEALALDDQCVDALRLMAAFGADSRDEYTQNLREAVAAGERSLGKKLFAENRGHFWGIIETRPYMRARFDLAYSLWKLDQIEAAIDQFEAILELNSSDNLGAREFLIGCYLALRRLEETRRLLEQYEEDIGAVFAWARVLERYLASDLPGAAAALADARKTNKHVEAYLTGKKRVPEMLPESYGLGDRSEAIHCAASLGIAWTRNPEALSWLRAA